MDYLKVKDHKDLVRDKNTKAILNTDKNSLNKYKEEREYKAKVAEVVKNYDTIKSDVEEIKKMLQTLLGKV